MKSDLFETAKVTKLLKFYFFIGPFISQNEQIQRFTWLIINEKLISFVNWQSNILQSIGNYLFELIFLLISYLIIEAMVVGSI